MAVVLSGMVGFERELHGRAAGFRTHILLCVGATLIMLTSIHVFDAYRGLAPCDPSRIAAGVVTGIGFLGAGTIMRFRASVIGLTTAASLWVVSGIGLALGSGFYFGAIVTTVLTLGALFALSRLGYLIPAKVWHRFLFVESRMDADSLKRIREVLARHNAEIHDFEVEKSVDGARGELRLNLRFAGHHNADGIVNDISRLENVKAVRWEENFGQS